MDRGADGLHPWGCKESNTMEHTHTCTVVATTVQGPDSYSRTESLTLPTAESVGGPQLSAESLSHISILTERATSLKIIPLP